MAAMEVAMDGTKAPEQAHLLDVHETLNVMGPTVELLTLHTENDRESCLMKGTIPAGGVIPLHSHADPETFIVVSGEAEALSKTADRFTWIPIRAGDVFLVPKARRTHSAIAAPCRQR